jgi:hypothetical protein
MNQNSKNWQTTFIAGYLTSLSNAGRKRVAKGGKHPFINNLRSDEWKWFLDKSKIDLIDDIKWTRIKLKT